MKTRIVCFFFFVLPFIVKSQTVFISDSGNVSFYSYALIENIEASCSQVNSMINTFNGEVAFMIPIRCFHFAKALMQEHFNEKYMESGKYPQATFNGHINEKIDIHTAGTYSVTTTGKLSIHGVVKEVNESGQLEVSENNLILHTKFRVALQDYNIKKPELLFNNIADTIDVSLNAFYYPFKKK